MKFCYLDESGTGDEPIAVMAGVITDASRMRVTKQHWSALLAHLSEIVGRQIHEIHTRDFYSGNSPWRDLDGQQRPAIISAIFDWLRDRKHHIVYTAVDKGRFFNEFDGEPFADDIGTLWRFMGLHVTLALQRHFQGQEKNKGNTVLIFDNEQREQLRFTDLILNAPAWTDTYYGRCKKQEKLNQIIDVPHFVDSRDVGLIQLADFVCFFLRKHIELQAGLVEPAYTDEVERVSAWVRQALGQSIPKANMYLSKGRCEAAELFYRYAPEVILWEINGVGVD
jgi:hypothetical protein